MVHNALKHPDTDPTPIFEIYRGSYASELLTAAITHFDLFRRLDRVSCSLDVLREGLGLEHRPATVLITALKAMGFLREADGLLELTEFIVVF